MEKQDPTSAPKCARRTKTLSQADVAKAIRDEIRDNNLVPGQWLVEAELSERLGTSRTTLRAALMDLAHEGLVERIANRGARVRVVELDEALKIVEVRMAIESLCVARAAERITEEEIQELRDLTARLKERADQNDVVGYPELTHQVFLTYVRIADLPVAREMLELLRDRMARHRFRLTYRPGRAQVSLSYWLSLIDAICRRDPEGARQAVQCHVANIIETMKALVPKPPTD